MSKETMMKLKYLMLDTEQTQQWINHLFNKAKEEYFNKGLYDDVTEINSAQDKALMCLEIYKKNRKCFRKTRKRRNIKNFNGVIMTGKEYLIDYIQNHNGEEIYEIIKKNRTLEFYIY